MWRVIVLTVCLGLFACSESPPASFHSTDISGAEFGSSLAAFKNHRGQATRMADFQGKIVVVFFGYTACPDVCPTTLARFAAVMKQLGTDAERVQIVMVTVDPEHDTPEKLAAYMSAFNSTFLGLYGDLSATAAAAQAFKVFYSSRPASAMDEPMHEHTHEQGHEQAHEHAHESADQQTASVALIDHSAGSYVFDPVGRIRLYVKDDASIDAIASDLKRLLAGA